MVSTGPPSQRCPHHPMRLLRALPSSARGGSFQFTVGFPPVTCGLSLSGYKKGFTPALQPPGLYLRCRAERLRPRPRVGSVGSLRAAYLPALSHGTTRRGGSKIFISPDGVMGALPALPPFAGTPRWQGLVSPPRRIAPIPQKRPAKFPPRGVFASRWVFPWDGRVSPRELRHFPFGAAP